MQVVQSCTFGFFAFCPFPGALSVAGLAAGAFSGASPAAVAAGALG